MKDFFALHQQVFVDNPVTVLLIAIWGIWYINYKLRAIRRDSEPARKHEHRKRIWVGILTLVCAFLILPGITSDVNAQYVRTNLTGETTAPNTKQEPSSTPPQTFSPETVYDPQDTYLYSLLGNLESEPGSSQKMVPMITNLKTEMPTGLIDISKLTPKLAEDHNSTMALLDLMRDIPYASHGYNFQRPATKNFFSYFNWYTPRNNNVKNVEAEFNVNEKANAKNLEDFERQHWLQ